MATFVGPHMVPIADKPGTLDFLTNSHFTLCQEEKVIPKSMKSVFKRDYPPWDVNGRPPAAKPPAPAHILHSDVRHFAERNSETTKAYQEKQRLPPEALKDKYKALSATNFKMDSDLSKFDSFRTTQQADFTPQPIDAFKAGAPQDARKSHIPQGDPDKAPLPISDYRDRYRQHCVPRQGPISAIDGPPTIQGDQRTHNYNTSHNLTFTGASGPKTLPFIAPTDSNIPIGDPSKESVKKTIMGESYIEHDQCHLQPNDRSGTQAKLQATHFNLQDGHGRWDTYKSTFKDDYRAMSVPALRNARTNARNISNFPTGDADACRNADRAIMTTNRYYQGTLPPYGKPKKEIGANKNTKSKVVFGDPDLADAYFETTAKTDYRPIYQPYSITKPTDNPSLLFPKNVYPMAEHDTTMRTCYKNPRQGMMRPNPEALDKLQSTHIRPQLKNGYTEYSTEYKERYIPKEVNVNRMLETGKLQKSSVPMGMNIC